METKAKSLVLVLLSLVFISFSSLASDNGKVARQNADIFQMIEKNALEVAREQLKVMTAATFNLSELAEVAEHNALEEVNEQIILSKKVQQQRELAAIIEQNAAEDTNLTVIGRKVDMSAFIRLMEENANQDK